MTPGDIVAVAPAHWRVVPLWSVARRLEDRGYPDALRLSVYRDHGVIPTESRDDNFNKPGEDLSAYRIVRPGDLVVNKMKTWQGSLGVSDHEGIVSPAYFVCSLSADVHPRWMHYLLRSRPYIALYAAWSKGIRPNQWDLPYDDFRNVPVLLPPLEEQRRIADFLDCESARAQSLITARRRHLSLIEQRSMAIVYQTVRGESESGERRPSGLDWLGSIPMHWPLSPVSTQFEVMLGKMLNADRSQGAHIRPYLRNVNVQWDHVDTEELAGMDFPPNDRRHYELRPGDLLVCEGGEPGRAAIWDGRVKELYYQKALHRVRSRDHSLPRWLYYCMRAATALNVFSGEGNTTTIAHLTREQLKAHRFPFPHPETQGRLVRQLDETMGLATALRRAMRDQVQRLMERQDALITAAVTGQIDVTTARGVA